MANDPIANEDPFKNMIGTENDLNHIMSNFVDSEDEIMNFCESRYIHPSPKVMADFFQKQKSTWCPHPICTIFGGCIKCMQVFIFCANILTFCISPFCTGVLIAVSVTFFKSSLNIIVNFLLKFVGFRWNFLHFKHDRSSLSHPHFMAIGLTVTKPSANKCRSLCKLINNSVHAILG